MSDINFKLPNVRGEYRYREPMKKYTWLNVGGPAEVMFFPKDIDDLRKFMRHKPTNVNVFVLGGGSNLLVRDGGIPDVVIKLTEGEFSQCCVDGELICCGAGMKNFLLQNILLQHKIGGLEFLCSIPGSIGGAIKGNAGCFGASVSDILDHVQVMDGEGKIFAVQSKQLGFAYRQSNFPADWIILKAWFKGVSSTEEDIQARLNEQKLYRITHQPQGIKTAGSTFKNPQGYSAWELIKKSGGSSFKVGGAKMSEKHCNFLENDGTASSDDIEKLCTKIMNTVKKKTGVSLEWEIQRIGREKSVDDKS